MEKEKMKYVLLMALALPLADQTLAAGVDCPQKTAELLTSLNAADLISGSDEAMSLSAMKFCEKVVVTAQQAHAARYDEWHDNVRNKPGHERLKRRARK
jgi:hypothetical protein